MFNSVLLFHCFYHNPYVYFPCSFVDLYNLGYPVIYEKKMMELYILTVCKIIKCHCVKCQFLLFSHTVCQLLICTSKSVQAFRWGMNILLDIASVLIGYEVFYWM